MMRNASPWIGVLFFFCLIHQTKALDSPREILIEATNPIALLADSNGTRTGLPDLDGFLAQHPGAVTRYALAIPEGRHGELKRFLQIRLPQTYEKGIPDILVKIARLSSVRWAQPNHLFRSHFTPDDPFYPDQWGLFRVGAQNAWDATKGSENVPIAIIDTGCQMDHPDLIPSFWVNSGEIADNGLDDDGNGFVDDIHGWDFVDALTFPTSGDYLERDNDPSDENGHGTAVAGICGAAINNGIGVAGLAPDCPLMILRAGNMDGYLQEDDVASAILYALDNGARVANMSFGDLQASPMLEEVINYAFQHGLLMVAASGNYGSANPVYPAAFGPTLAVGACDEQNFKAGFSSYGVFLDLLAPGTNILSTVMGGDYSAFQGGNGTSFAAPFASATAGLVLSLHPQWDPPSVISAIKSTCDDVGTEGWDSETGHGILRADKAVEVGEALMAEITSPAMGQGFAAADTLDVIGTASGVYISDFSVYTGIGSNPNSWDLIKEANGVQAIDALLVTWRNYEPLDTAYTIRLKVRDIFGNEVEDLVVIYADPSPPTISDISLISVLDADRPSYLLSFNTDDETTGKVWIRDANEPGDRWTSLALNYEAKEHTVFIGGDLAPKEYIYYIWVENLSGLIDSTDILGTIDLTTESIATNYFVQQPPSGIPPGYLYEDATDLDGDGFLEIWEDTLDAGGGKSDLRAYEATSSWAFTDLGLDFGLEIPKSIGDSDADSLMELLTLYGGRTRIFEATTQNGFPQPDNVVWSDSGDVWGAKLLDFDPTDGHGEVLLVSGGVYQLYSNDGSGELVFMQALPDPFDSSGATLSPYCRVNDYDGDGLTELLFGDYGGNLYIYERKMDGTFTLSWSDSLPLLDTGEFITDGDYDGDGNVEFAALAHSQTLLMGEYQANTRYWGLFIFHQEGDDQYAVVDTLYFFGAESPSDFAAGISSGNVYGNEKSEILLCVYPDFYVVGFNSVSNEYSVLWYYPQCLSNKAVVGDYNQNGHGEMLFNSGNATLVFEQVGNWSYWPPAPINFSAAPAPDRVILSWDQVTGAETYNVYRGDDPSTLGFLAEILQPLHTYTDFAVQKDTTYYYAVSTVDLGLPIAEGPTTFPVKAIPNDPPFVIGDTAHYESPGFVTVQFNEPMGPSLEDPNHYWIASNSLQPNSVVSDQGGARAILSFDPVFEDTTYRLIIFELFDLQGSPFSTLYDTLRFTVTAGAETPPYLITAYPSAGGSTVNLVFSQPIITTELASKNNYSITADPLSGLTTPDPIIISTAAADSNLHNVSHLYISANTPIGAQGKIYRVTAKNLHSTSGLAIDTTRNQATLSFAQNDLDGVYVYPNPYTQGTLVDGEECVVFANLTPDVEIHILTLSGIVIKKLKATGNISGGIRWYLDNEHGETVGSGIYLYFVSGGGDTFWGKLAVAR